MNAKTALIALALVGCTATTPRQVTELTPELAPVVEGNNAFAVDLYKAGVEQGENLFFSPFSVHAALGMTWAGAAGDTATQMADVMHVSEPDGYHATFGALIRDLNGDLGRGYTLNIANKLWGQDGFGYEQPFLDITADDYGAPMEIVDFTADPGGIRDAINEWVSDQTQGKIPELMPQGSPSVDSRLVLVNAIYFLGDWQHQFDKADTDFAAFQTADGEVQASTMDQTGSFRHTVDDGVAVLELPYVDDEVSFLVVLPEDDDGLDALERDLTAEQIDGWVAALHEGEVHVRLPKFELEHELPLTSILKGLGMTLPFEAGVADFTHIADADLFIAKTVHKAFVSVDEKGTEAAAATGVDVGITSMPEVTEFIADHPFLFLIRDRLTGTTLFMGRIADPSGLGPSH